MGSCCEKQKVEEVCVDNNSFQGFTILNRWKATRFIGRGSFGKVYEAIDINTKELYAIKIEKIHSNRYGEMTGRLPHEDQVIGEIRNRGYVKHLVEIVDRGPLPSDHRSRPSQFIVMTLLGPSLVDLAEYLVPKKAFSPSTMSMIGKQTVEVLQAVHECGYIHRDIKPANFVVGLHEHKHEVYLIDFGLARRYVDDNGRILPPRPKVPFRGTVPYVSYNAYNGREQSPEDDLWSLFYTLIDLRTGSLPWARIMRSSSANELKIKVSPWQWLKEIEPEYLTVYEFLTSLRYDIYPNYSYLNELFNELMKRLNVSPDVSPMDWEPGGCYYQKYKPQQLMAMFRE